MAGGTAVARPETRTRPPLSPHRPAAWRSVRICKSKPDAQTDLLRQIQGIETEVLLEYLLE